MRFCIALSGYVWRCSHLAPLLVVVGVLAGARVANGEGTATIVRVVEEDWELVVATPDADSTSPQVICVISPEGHLDSHHAALNVNYQSLPDFASGGLQLQVWEGELPLYERKSPEVHVMNTDDETVCWTQVMHLQGSTLTFEITNGSSTTWGTFGHQGQFSHSVQTSLADLNQYDPTVSVDNSGAGYAANRVQSLVLKRIRLITSTGELYEDTTPRVVHQN